MCSSPQKQIQIERWHRVKITKLAFHHFVEFINNGQNSCRAWQGLERSIQYITADTFILKEHISGKTRKTSPSNL